MPSTQPSARLREAVAGFGASIVGVAGDGVDFTLGDISGFAIERHGKLSGNLLIVRNPDAETARWFIARHESLPGGSAQLVNDDEGSSIRLNVELDFDDELMWTIGNTARGLRSAWLNRERGGLDLIDTLSSSGIVLPPLGPFSAADIYTYDSWDWGTHYVQTSQLFDFNIGLVVRLLFEHNRLFTLAHGGYGVNSYFLTLITSAGPIAACVQHGYGGVYSNPVQDLIEINATYSRLHVLWRAIDAKATANPRWLLMYSSRRHEIGIIDLAKINLNESVPYNCLGSDFEGAVHRYDSESDLFEAAAKLPPVYPIVRDSPSLSW